MCAEREKIHMKNEIEMQSWHLDRRVPVALIAAIAFQTAGALLWAGAVSQRLSFLEQRAAREEGLLERTARVEEQALSMRGALRRIETKLDNAIAGQ